MTFIAFIIFLGTFGVSLDSFCKWNVVEGFAEFVISLYIFAVYLGLVGLI